MSMLIEIVRSVCIVYVLAYFLWVVGNLLWFIACLLFPTTPEDR